MRYIELASICPPLSPHRAYTLIPTRLTIPTPSTGTAQRIRRTLEAKLIIATQADAVLVIVTAAVDVPVDFVVHGGRGGE